MSNARRLLACAVRLSIASTLFNSSNALGADIDKATAAPSTANGYKPLVTADRQPTPILAPVSKEGEVRIKQFKVAPGLKVDLWAAEPMLANPVAFTVDERGRVFTSETYRYRSSVLDIRHYMFMLEDDLASRSIEDRLKVVRKWFGPEGEKALSVETEVIRMLEDSQGKGHADTSTVLAEGLSSPLDGIASGVLARHGEVWVTDIPSLWRFRPDDAVSRPARPLPAPTPGTASTPRTKPGYKAEELLRGFGVRFSFTGHDLHGLKFGPDGRLYFSCGDRGAHIVTAEGKVIDLADEGAVFRCEPDGSNLEVVHRGLRNPQELAFDEYGNLFTGDNDSDQGDRERWVLVTEGADSGWRVGHQHAPLGNAGMWNLERLWVPQFEGQAAYVLPPLANIGDGPSGVVYDYAGTYSPSRTGADALGSGGPAHRFLLAYFKGTSAKSGVYSIGLRPRGASFEVTAHDEFVWNSLVPDVDIGPDGAVWFADWHEGWPKSNKGRIYRAYLPANETNPAIQETRRLLAEGMSHRGGGELLALLTHPDMRIRQEAQFELASRGVSSVEGLRRTALQPGSVFARLHALWGLGQIARSQPPASVAANLAGLTSLLEDADPEVRGQTAKLLGSLRVETSQSALVARLKDGSERVRFNALQALADLGGVAPGASVTQGGAQAGQKLSAATLASIETFLKTEPSSPLFLIAGQRVFNDAAAIRRAYEAGEKQPGGTKMTSRLYSYSALLAARRLKDPIAAAFLTSWDPKLVLEAARAINDAPIPKAVPQLAALGKAEILDSLLKQSTQVNPEGAAAATEVSPGVIRDVRADQPLPWTNAPVDFLKPLLLRIVNANFRDGTAASAERLATMAVRTDLPELIRSEAILALANWGQPPARDRITGNFQPLPSREAAPAVAALEPKLSLLLGTAPAPLRIAAAEAAVQLKSTRALPALLALVQDAAAPAVARAAALRALVALKSPAVAEALKFAASDKAEPVRLEASKLNAELNPNDAAGQLSSRLSSGSIAEQQGAFQSLGNLRSDSADAILADWLDRLMKREVANEVMLDLVEAAEKRSSTAVKQRLAAYQDWKLPKDHLTPWRETIAGGDAERGRKIFYERQEVACTRCHKVGTDGGGDVGPNLSGIATRGTVEHILESIVFPNKQIADGFESVLLTLKNGTSVAGVLKQETATEITVHSPEDGPLVIKKADITARERGLSGMPDGMGQLLTRQELRDLIQFLNTLR